MSAAQNIFDFEHIRIRILLILMLAAFVFLGGVMWWFQVARGQQYERHLDRQSVRRVKLPGLRGRVYDRNGICLADNRPSYGIAIYLEELRQFGGRVKMVDKVERTVLRLTEVLGLAPEIDRNDILNHIKKRLPLPLLVWRDIDEKTLARFSEQAALFPGVDIYVDAQRVYPMGRNACHLLGYVGRAEPVQDEEEPFHYFLPELAGTAGVEKRFDGVLRGESGGRLVRVDVAGFRHEDIGERESRKGSDVLLALDLRVQRLADEILRESPGALVVVDPNNGDVLAMASSPGYNPNDFVPAISAQEWKALLEDPGTPLVNKTIAGEYAPGSTFKPVVAMAALENKLATAGTSFDCPGYFDLGGARFRCWTRGQHGLLNMRQALEHSCNVYFFRLGLQIGHEYILHMASALGFGRLTGINLDFESAGMIPSEAWMKERFGHGWRAGDTCNLSIGQGALATTPLQMALLTATLANGGHLFQPRLVVGVRDPDQKTVHAFPPHVANEMNWSVESLNVVRGGMKDVVMSEHGTGKLAHVPELIFAGKTGTAEYGKKEEGKKRGWMIAFAPYDQPRYAVALVVEEAMTGGVTVAPMIQRLMRGLFGVGVNLQGQG